MDGVSKNFPMASWSTACRLACNYASEGSFGLHGDTVGVEGTLYAWREKIVE